MHVRVRLDGRTDAALARGAAAAPAPIRPGCSSVDIDDTPGSVSWPAKADLLFRLESLVHGLQQLGLGSAPARRTPTRGGPGRRGRPDLILDLCGDVPDRCRDVAAGLRRPSRRAGSAREPARRTRYRTLALIADSGSSVAEGRLGADRPADRARQLRRRARPHGDADRRGAAAPRLPGTRLHAAAPTIRGVDLARAGSLGARAGRMLAAASSSGSTSSATTPRTGAVGWRWLTGPDLIDLGRHPDIGLDRAAGRRQAVLRGSVPIAFGGETGVFVEDLHPRDRQGRSSRRSGSARTAPRGCRFRSSRRPTISPTRSCSSARASVWMVPESRQPGRSTSIAPPLPRAAGSRRRRSCPDVVASDATLVAHAGRWWIFATVRDAAPDAPAGSGSFHDALHLWSAPDFRGPWTPHPANPVLIDPAVARPAGRIVVRGGHLIRPVQDCATGYGRALALARIDRLDLDGFAQTVIARIGAGPAWPGSRLHTVNAGGGIECIDGSGRAPRFALFGRPRMSRSEPGLACGASGSAFRRPPASEPGAPCRARGREAATFSTARPWRERARTATCRWRGCRVRQEHYPRGLIDSLGSCPWPRPWTWPTRRPPTL